MPTRSLISTLALLVVATAGVGAAQKETNARSLYQRLGGYDAIASILSDLERRFAEDPELKHFIAGTSADTGKRQSQLLVELLCERTGGPCAYIGRDLKTAHTGLTITEAHWKSTLGHFGAAIDAAKVSEKDKAELIEIVVKLKPDIMVK